MLAPLLRVLARLARAQAATGSGVGMTLVIYIQKQLWTNMNAGAVAQQRSLVIERKGGPGQGGQQQQQGWLAAAAAAAAKAGDGAGMGARHGEEEDDQRKLASLVLAEALVLLKEGQAQQAQRAPGRYDAYGKGDKGEGEEDGDVGAVLAWVVRAVPLASPRVAAQGLRLLLRVLAAREGGAGGSRARAVC